MRPPRRVVRAWDVLRRNWRVPRRFDLPADSLIACPLEERRVLSASLASTLVDLGAISSAEGAALNLEIAQPLPADGSDTAGNAGAESSQARAGFSTAARMSARAEGGSLESPVTPANPLAVPDAEPGNDLNAEPLNANPVLRVARNQALDEGELLSLTDIGTFTDPDGGAGPYTYTIDWGDGLSDSGTATIDSPGNGEAPTLGSFDGSHTYADNGIYKVEVTIDDGQGGTATGTFTVIVNNVAPSLTVAEDQVVDKGAELVIPVIGSFTDPGFDNPLNQAGETHENFSYVIDWGDGTDVDTGSLDGGPGPGSSGAFGGSHTYVNAGVYTVTVTLSDDDGGTVNDTFTVTVEDNNQAPVLRVARNQVLDEGELLSLTDIGTFTDPDGGAGPYTYTIDWGDGLSDSGTATIDSPGNGQAPTLGSFDGSHTYADNGIYKVEVTIDDGQGGTATGTFTVIVNNVPPVLTVAEDQVVDEGTELVIPVIGSFTDPGFDNPLNETGETQESFTYVIDWGDGTDVDTGSLDGGPGPGSSGTFGGSHTYADNGIYTVTVTVSDDDGGTVTETFTVTVNNVPPVLTVAEDQVVDEGAELVIPVIGSFTDPGFDNPLNVGGETQERFAYVVDWGDGTDVDTGTLEGGPGPGSSGTFGGSHTYADNGIYTVTVTVSDDDGGTVTETFTVTVNNVDPTLIVAEDQVTDEGSLLSIPVIGTFTDPGFDNPLNEGGETVEEFTYSIDWGDGTAPDTGTLDGGLPPGSSGTFGGSHIYADNGIYTVTVTVSDDDGGVAVETFTVTVNNVTPTLIVPDDQVVEQGDVLSLPDLFLMRPDIGTFTDPGFDNPLNEGGETVERFTYSIDWGDGSEVDSGPAPILTPGGPGVLTAGAFAGSHTYLLPGTYTVTVTLSDDDGGTAVGTFQVRVVASQPLLFAGMAPDVNEGQLLSVVDIGTFVDPRFRGEGGAGTYTYSINWGDGTPDSAGAATIDAPGSFEGPTLGSFDGQHIYADNGPYTVTLTLFTSDGRSATTTLQVQVHNVAPTLTSVGPDQVVSQTRPLTVIDIAKFFDPGFDNPLNVGGETVERFTYEIDWGDGSPLDSGPGTIDSPGGPTVSTLGSLDGGHTYFIAGTFTVTVTVFDDDGGSDTATFQVEVQAITQPVFIPFTGGGGGDPPIRPVEPGGPSRLLVPPDIGRIDLKPYRVGAVAGDELRLVLRKVSPVGVEDREGEEILPEAVLDNLRSLFARLPDGHYRIYQIQPDDVERLVVDVLVRQGRPIDAAEDAAELGEALPALAPAAEQADEVPGANDGAAIEAESQSDRGAGWLVGGMIVSPSVRRLRFRRQREQEQNPLAYGHRLLKRARSSLKNSTSCAIAGMRSQNDDASRFCASRAELSSALGEVEISHDGLFQQTARSQT